MITLELTTVWRMNHSWLIIILLPQALQLMTLESLGTEFWTLITIPFKQMISINIDWIWENIKRKKTIQNLSYSTVLNKRME